MKVLSLFDGSGGFPLAGAMCGITPVAASEVEPFPIRVTTKRFPNMKHLGDISKINGAEIEPVDVITFGSPCQDLSVAGKRKGLSHSELGDEETTRSGLFMEAVRIIREMKEATNGEYPTFAVWENVPGAYSSNKGEDFRIVLEELEKTACNGADIVPKPPKGKWLNSGEIVGDNYSIAWRTLDAQFWGVPQRCRRIYLVADFRGQRAGKILFEREGLRGNFTQSREEGQGTAGNAEGGIGATDREGKILTAELGIASRDGGHCYENIAGTLRANAGDNQLSVVYAEDGEKCVGVHMLQDPITRENLSPCIGVGGGNVPSVLEKNIVYDGSQVTCPTNSVNPKWNDPCHTLHNDSRNILIQEKSYCLQGSMIGRQEQNGPRGGDYGGGSETLVVERPQYIVRRLTPLECCRLQGFPDCWCNGLETPEPTEEDLKFWREVFETHRQIVTGASKPKTDKQIIKWLKDPYSDSAIYKMWGNGIALPNALFVMQGIAEELCEN